MSPVEVIDLLEKEFAQLQVNLQAHIQIKQILNATRQKIDAPKIEKQGPQESSSEPN